VGQKKVSLSTEALFAHPSSSKNHGVVRLQLLALADCHYHHYCDHHRSNLVVLQQQQQVLQLVQEEPVQVPPTSQLPATGVCSSCLWQWKWHRLRRCTVSLRKHDTGQ